MNKQGVGIYAVNLPSFALLLFLTLGGSVSAAAFSKCPGDLSELDCRCAPVGQSKYIQIYCQLGENFTISGLFNKLGEASKLRIYKLAITSCKNPMEVLQPLPNLKVPRLDIFKCGIKKVDEKAFDGLADDLIELGLSNNSLTSLPFLGKLKNLQLLKLGFNQIKEIPEHSFDGLEKLRFLRLGHNQICSLLPNALSETKNSLELLDLSYNCFSSIPAQSLRSSVALAHLALRGNKISDITQMQLMNLPKLIDLWLNDNRISSIAPNAFMNVPNLKHIVLSNNLLATLEPATLQALRDVQFIDISGNQLSKVPVFKEHPFLYDLRLNNNKIKKIETLAFSSIPLLTTINLAGNEISDISRNSFDQLNSLKTLILSNNSLQTIERYMFDGLRSLDSLLLSNNSIAQLDENSFASVPELLILDLSINKLQRIEKGTFAKFNRMNFLDLSRNSISTFEADSFNNRIGTIVLDGNQFNCDKKFDWFLSYLARNDVRIFLPTQPDIVCASPEELGGTRVKDLLMKKANESILNFSGSSGTGRGDAAVANANLLSQFLPSFTSPGSAGNANFLQALTQAMPSLRNIPAMNNFVPKGTQRSALFDPNNPQIAALEKFTAPLVKFASGNQPVASDIGQLLKSIPELIVNVPGIGDVDITKLRPDVVEHVLKGGEIPGISRNVLDRIMKQYMERLYYAAAKQQGQNPVDVLTDDLNKPFNTSKYLLPLTELPPNMITTVMSGKSLPYLNMQQTQTIKDYYTQQIPLLPGGSSNVTDLFNPRALQMIKLLPRGYNFTRISPEIIHSVLQGQMPDFRLFPEDLQRHLMENMDKIINTMGDTPNTSIHEVLRRLPSFPVAELSTFSPYDINKINAELVGEGDDEGGEKASASAHRNKILTAVALGLVAAATVVVLIAFFIYTKRTRERAIAAALAADTMTTPARLLAS